MLKFFKFSLTLVLLLVSVGIKAQYLTADFNDATSSAISSGWDVTDNDPVTITTSSVWAGDAGGYSGACAYSCMYGANALKARMKSPSFTLPALSQAMVSFMMKAGSSESTAGILNIYISTDGGATYLTNVIASNVVPTTSWTEYSFPITGYSGPVKLVLEAVGSGTSSYRYIYIDNLVVKNAPTCQVPTGLYITDQTSSSANFGWSLDSRYGSSPNQYSVSLKDSQGNVVYYNSSITSTSVSFTNLQENTTYTAFVRSDCAASSRGYSDSVSITFTTLSNAIEAPFYQNFDDLVSIPINYQMVNAELSSAASVVTGGKSVKLNTTASNYAAIVFPPINLAANNFEIDFQIRRYAAETATVKAINYLVGYLADPSDIATLVPLAIDSISGDVSWRNVHLNSSAVTSTSTPTYIGIVIDMAYVTSVYVDEVSIRAIPSCIRPEKLTVSNIGTDQVTLSWEASNASLFNVKAKKVSDSSEINVTASGSPFTMTGLDPNTDYEFSVQGVCSASDLSDWSIFATAKTECGVAQNPLFIETFDALAANQTPECWSMGWLTKPSSNNLATPFTASTTAKHGSSGKSMSLEKQTDRSVAYISTNAINFDSVGKYQLSVWVNRATARAKKSDEGLQIWVTNAPGDTTGGVLLEYIHREPTYTPAVPAAGWYQYEYLLNVQGIKYITVLGISQNGAAVYFDDLEVTYAPTCIKVANISLGTLTSNSAEINWTAGKNESQWIVDYEIAQGSTIVKDTTAVVNNPACIFQGLTPSTAYNVTGTVRSYCGVGDTAAAVSFSFDFTTECLPLTNLPYINDFENEPAGTGLLPNCWRRINNSTNSTAKNYPYNYSAAINSHSGTKVLYFQIPTSADAPNAIYAVLPQVDPTIYPINTLRLKFWAKRNATASYSDAPFIFGVMQTSSGVDNFIPVDTVLVSNSESHRPFVVDFSSYTGNGSYIAIRLEKQGSTCYAFIDDIQLEVIPACPDLNGDAIISDNTDSSVKITVADSTAYNSWSYAYGIAGTPVSEMTAIDAVDTSVVLTGLASSTTYDLYVRRKCGNEYGSWSYKVPFTTTAVPATAPYVCGFEYESENSQWQFVKGASDNMFKVGTVSSAVHSGSKSIYLSYNNGTSNIYETEESSRNYAYRTIHFDSKGYQIEFYWRCPGGEGYEPNIFDYGRVLLLPASVSLLPGETGTKLSSSMFSSDAIFLDPDNANCMNMAGNDWHFVSKFVDMTGKAGNYNLVLVWNNDASDGNENGPLAVDDISITELACIAPSTINVLNLTADSATISIIQPTASQWEIVVDSTEFTIENIPANPMTRITSANGNVILSGLNPNTEYYYSIRSICGTGTYSDWSEPSSFRTLCLSRAVPYVEGFEVVSSANCWNMVPGFDQESSVSRSVLIRRSGLASMQNVNSSMFSPELQVDSLTHYLVNFWAYATEDNAEVSVGVIVDPNDVSTAEILSTTTIPVKNTWTEVTAYFKILNNSDYVDFKNAKHITISNSGNTVYYDDLTIDEAPSCPKPYEVTITNVTSNSFDISFSDGSGASQWIVYTNDVPHVVTSSPATISNLCASSNYNVSIVSVCSATETSLPTDCGIIKTPCGPQTTPFSCGFEVAEGYSGARVYSAAYADLSSQCWSVLNNRPNGSTNPSAHVSTSSAYHNGKQGLHTTTNSAATKNFFLIIPEMVEASNMLRIKFWYKNAGTSASSTNLMFGYFNGTVTDSTFVPVETMLKYSAWTEREIFTNTASYNIPANARLGFMLERNTSGGAIYIDDILINSINNCSDPEIATVSEVTASSAKVTFADTCSAHTSWEYVYGPVGFNPNTVIPKRVSSKEFVMTGLNEYTEYELYVRAVCDSVDVSNFVKAASSFRTLCSSYEVTPSTPFQDSFEDLPSGTKLEGCYVVEGNYSTSYIMKGGLENSSTFTQARTGNRTLQAYGSKTYAPNGQTAFRQLHLTAGKMYKASVWTRYVSGSGTFASIVWGKTASIDSATVLATTDLPTCGAVKINNVNTYEACYNELSGYIVVPETGDYFVGLHADIYPNETNKTIAAVFDDFVVEELTGCLPAIVTIDSVTQNAVYVHHSDVDPTHTYEYMVMNGDDIVIAPTATTANPFMITDLPNSLPLTLYVRQNCGEGDYSEWSVTEFSTACGAIDRYPYHQDFEGAFPPVCWSTFSYGTTANTWKTNGAALYNHSGQSSAAATNQSAGAKIALVTGEFNLNSPHGYYLRLWMYRYNTGNSTVEDEALHVGYLNAPITNATIYDVTELGVINRHVSKAPATTPESGYYEYEYEIPASVQGSVWFSFDYHNQAAGGAYIDDITIEPIPSCITPRTAPIVNSTTMTTANLAVDMKGKSQAQIAWAPSYKQDSIVGYTLTTTGNAVATGLAATTEYAFKYRYVCADGDTSVWSPVALGTTTATDCFDPQNLHIVGAINHHHAAFSWGKAPLAVGYEYTLKRGAILVVSAVTMNDTIAFDTLATNTSYTFSIRTLCGSDTLAWQTISFKTTYEVYDMPYICGFEDATQNFGWHMNQISNSGSNLFIIGTATSQSGIKSLYVSNDNSTYNYGSGETVSDAEVLLNMPEGNYMISYDWNCKGEDDGSDYYDYGRVFLAPGNAVISGSSYEDFASSLPAGYMSLDNSKPLSNASDWRHVEQMKTIVTGGIYKLVALWANDGGVYQPPLAIDNISIERITCMQVNSVNVVTVNSRDAKAIVSRYDESAVEYAIATTESQDSLTWFVATSDTLSFTNLIPGETYNIYVRHSCSATDKSRVVTTSFTTPINSMSLPFVATFESNDTANSYWYLTSGTAENRFTMGNAASGQGERSLYITDNGSANNYSGATSWSYAYIPLQIASGMYEVSYQWRSNGEGTFDYGRIFLASTEVVPQDNALLSGLSATTLPAGSIALDAEYGELNLSNEWVDAATEIYVHNSGTYNLIVAWHNNASVYNQSPLAIDNISIKELTCPKINVANVSVDSVSFDMFRLKVSNNNANAGIVYHVSTNSAFTDTIASGVTMDSVITVSGLAASSWYNVRLRSYCGVGDTSSVVAVTVRTECGSNSIFPYVEDFESYTTSPSSYASSGELEDYCWNVSSTNPGAYYTIFTSNVHSGLKSLNVYNNSTAGVTQTFAMPKVDVLAGKQISMWYKNFSGTAGTYALLEVGYLTNPNDLSTFTVSAVAPFNTAYSEFVYRYPATTPANARPAFRANGSHYIYIDDIRINNVQEGVLHQDTICFGSAYNGNGFSCPAGSLAPGDTVLSRMVRVSASGVADSIVRVNVYVRPQIYVNFYDTICAGQPYTRGQWNIPNPATDIYFNTFTSVSGCDSTVNLSLFVVPTYETISDTICEGDVYQFGDSTLTVAGTYARYTVNQYGCNDTIMLTLIVVDTATHITAQTCSGTPYVWEGQSYTQSGTYTKVVQGDAQCMLTKYLHLTVLPTDSICNVSFCAGGSVMVADTVIDIPGQYTIIRHDESTTCDITYYITATQNDPITEYLNDEVCENEPYYGYGVTGVVITQDTVVTENRRTQDGMCDSIVVVNVKLNPTIYGDPENVTITEGESYTWHENTYTAEGTYRDTLWAESTGCDSICTLILTVSADVENVEILNVSLVPNPVNAGQTVFVHGNFDNVKSVEILNSFGQVIDTFVPKTYPIEVQGIEVSGIYYIRATTEGGKVAVEKLIVK